MAAHLIFLCMYINWPLKIILNFLHDNEVIRDNFYAYKEILNRRPFLNKVYSKKVAVHQYGTIRQTKQWHKTITTF